MTKQAQEESILNFWKDNAIYQKVQEKNQNSPQFTHVDGPPFPTGEPHMGHLRNWAIKDTVLRLKRLQGHNVYARFGYDVHGLPVEQKVQEKLGFKETKDLQEFGEENFVRECKKYTTDIISQMNERRERFGLWMDTNHYQTSHPEYLSLAWQFFKTAHKKGLLYKDYKTVAWSPALETTLSDYEIKDAYTTLEDPSIYVKFPLKDEPNTYLVIWTTTPWTLQSNMAIAVNGEFEYSYVEVEFVDSKKETYVLATALVEKCIDNFKQQQEIVTHKVIKTLKGAELEGLAYNHIYLEETPTQKELLEEGTHKHLHSVILADYVTLGEGEDILEKLEKKGNYKHSVSGGNTDSEFEGSKAESESESDSATQNAEIKTQTDSASQEGTGLVHIAPAHGFDDYEAAKKYNIPMFSPVDTKGILTEGVAKGMNFRDANEVVVENLKGKQFLLHSKMKSHRYPLCWRSKVPILYRATQQWYIRRSALTQDIIEENKGVNWHPEFARGVFDNLTQGAGDWAISRQRFWGIPLPIFEDDEGNFEVIGSKEELEQRLAEENKLRSQNGISQLLPESLDDIHRDDLKGIEITLRNGNKAKPVPYIADVWFDSGCASFASHYGEGLTFEEIVDKHYPMDFITEGQDQIRGWFSSLFNVGYMLTQKAPYKNVLFQQFVMAKDGSKMSKSLGNGIDANQALETWGADVTRYYLLTKANPEFQINFDPDELVQVQGLFNTLENVLKFMNSITDTQTQLKTRVLHHEKLSVEDVWILGRLEETLQEYVRLQSEFKVNVAFKLVENFLVKDLSKTYLKIVKERCENPDDQLVVVFERIIKKVLLAFAPAIPFLTEKFYQDLTLDNKQESIFLEEFPSIDETLISEMKSKAIDENFALSQEVVASLLNAREKAKIGVRWPLKTLTLLSAQNISGLKNFEELIKSLGNIKEISYDSKELDISYVVKPNIAALKQDFGNPGPLIKLITMNKDKISKDLSENLSGNEFDDVTLDYSKHVLKEIQISGEVVSSPFSIGTIVLHTHQDETLLKEGFLREIIRRVQQMRKNNGFEKSQEITLSFIGSDEYFLDLVEEYSSQILAKVGATTLKDEDLSYRESFEIKQKNCVISLE